MTSPTDLHPSAERRQPVSPRRARINFALFSIVAIGGGWLFVALDHATGELTGTGSTTSTSGTTGGQGLWILVPALTALALYFLNRDGAGPLGFTLRFANRTRWFTFALLLFPVAVALPVFLAGIVALAALYGEMRVRTGSIWPGVVLHTVSNALVTPLLINGHLRFEGHGDVLLSPVPSSVVSILLFGGTGLFLMRRRNRD